MHICAPKAGKSCLFINQENEVRKAMAYQRESWIRKMQKRDAEAQEGKPVTQKRELLRILRERRRALNMTQADVADMVGTHTGTVCHAEKGVKGPSLDMLIAMCQVLKMRIVLVPEEEMDDGK